MRGIIVARGDAWDRDGGLLRHGGGFIKRRREVMRHIKYDSSIDNGFHGSNVQQVQRQGERDGIRSTALRIRVALGIK
jgi:peptidoglycan hydrolase-like protein with peptidoglycan-binding domain